MLGATNFRNLKILMRHKIVHNCLVKVEYIEMTEKIFGPDVSTLNGRTTRQRTNVAVDDFIEMPR